jgi:succinyldiaminopimelate transaminase
VAVRVSPILARQATYPFVRIEEGKRRARERGLEILDFGMGDPRGVPDEAIRAALVAGLDQASGYPTAAGLPELREAIAAWCGRRFGVELDPDTEVVPTYGSKEAIFSFAQVVVGADKDVVVVTEPGYPVPERGAQFAHADVLALPLLEEHGFLPDLDSVDEDTWRRVAVLWLNYPNNPTGAIAPRAFFERALELAAEHDFVVASDEAYSELWFDEPPPGALEAGEHGRLVVFNSLSKRSSMTGYRSGFVAGSAEVIAALKAFRPNVGSAPQEFVQRASIVAWGDEAHVERNREAYRRRREPFLELFARKGIRLGGSRATFFLWTAVPEGETSEGFATRLLEHGVVVAPGSFLGPSGEGWVRFALVAPEEQCRRAVEILEAVL